MPDPVRQNHYRTANRLLHQNDPLFQGNMPLHLRVSLLESCNLRCYMCHLTALPEEKREDIGSELMPLDLFRQLAEDTFPYADRLTIGFAGEPTLHPQFAEFLQTAHSYGIEVEIYTNGTTLHKDPVAESIAQYADWLVVSMDGAEEETFAQIRGGADLRSIEQSLCSIRDRARQIERHGPLQIGAHFTMMRSNIHQLTATVEKAHRLEIDRVSSSHIGIFDGNLKEESLFLFHDEANQNLQSALCRAAELGIHTDFPPIFNGENQNTPVQNYRCFQTNYSLIVLSNGNVLPCCHAAARWRLVMGNLHQSRLPDIWYGYRYGLLRDAIDAGDLPPACQDCANNNPFMDVSTEWELESFSPRASQYKKEIEYIHRLQEYEKKLFREQKDLLSRALENEHGLAERFQQIAGQESQVDKRFHLTPVFEEQRPSPIGKFGCYAFPPSTNSHLRQLNRLHYAQGEEFQGNMPVRLEMSIVAGCNIQCIMCTLSHLPKEEQQQLLHRQMSKETYMQLANQVFPYAESIFFGIGGEPTIHPDFCEFVRIASEAGLEIHISSNGMAFSNDSIAQVCVEHIHHVIISMDGSTKETFERIRKGASWDRVIAGIQNLVSRRKETPESPLRLSINFTLMKDTIDEFPGIIELAHQLGIDKVMAEHLIATLPELEEQSLFTIKEHSDRRVRETIQRANQLNVEIELPDLFDMESTPQDLTSGAIRNIRPKEIKQDIPYCHILKYSAVITPTGYVLPCSHPDAQHQYRMGDLHKTPFQEIWYGPQYQSLREGHNGTTPPLCQDCAMSGRSDGILPNLNSKEPVPDFASGEKQSPYPQRFLLRRIQFIEALIHQNSQIQSHIDGVRNLGERMDQHAQNLDTVIAEKSGRPMLSAELAWIQPPPYSISANAHFSFSVRVRNTGRETWQAGSSESGGSIMIGGMFFQKRKQIAFMEGWGSLSQPLPPNQEAKVTIRTNTLNLSSGSYRLKINAVKLGDGFFDTYHSKPLECDLAITLADESEGLWRKAIPLCTNLWSLSQGIRQGRDGKYPLFITQTDRARITDMEGRHFLDYIMGWGTAVLGYNHPNIQEAVASHLSTGPTLPLPHPLQIDVAEKLSGFLPCAERILFGKNGSDVLEAAVRTARAYTRKDHVLCCGYHGFHDWSLASNPNVMGIPNIHRSLAHTFPYGDLNALCAQLDTYCNEIAAIVMEPASMAYPPDGYLQTIREWTQDRGIVLIFDEIMSAFRLANGGAQEKYGVHPDMVTVGKGIANGLPLAALGGQRKFMDRVFDVGYGPTFHGEVYALAAANAALDIYAREPVCAHINALGKTLRDEIDAYAKRYGIPLHLSGIDPRLVFEFQTENNYSPAQIRTYFLQELMEAGILCGGTLLPSYAHTQKDIQFTLKIIKATLKKLSKALRKKNLAGLIRIPLHVLYLGEE